MTNSQFAILFVVIVVIGGYFIIGDMSDRANDNAVVEMLNERAAIAEHNRIMNEVITAYKETH